MSAKQIIASIPSMPPEKRAIMKANAERQRDTGNDAQRAAALEVLDALDKAAAEELAARRALLAAHGIKAAIVDSFARSRMTETCQWRPKMGPGGDRKRGHAAPEKSATGWLGVHTERAPAGPFPCAAARVDGISR